MWRQGWLYEIGLGIVYTVLRIIFWAWNRAFLEGEGNLWRICLAGILFDWYAVSWVLVPVWFFLLIGWRCISYAVWIGVGSFALALEVIDIGYFPYSHRRSGIELIRMLSFWQDTLPALSKYMKDFLLGFLFWGLLVGVLIWWGGQVKSIPSPAGWVTRLGWLFSLVGLVIGLRGGVRLKPLTVIDAAQPECLACTPYVLNTTFSMLKALEQPPLPPWPPAPSGIPLYPRQYTPGVREASIPRYNVVVFILESFSAEYVEKGYAPFLSQLLQKGSSVKWGFACNSRSAEGVPAILSGIPSWGEEPLIFTPYAVKIRYSLGDILKKWGYKTLFFHGGNNGTMLLDSYARQAGFETYIGRKEYPFPDRDYDGTWGIWDEPFLQFCLEQLASVKEPFAAAIFTLSSHHPYAIPKQLQDSFRIGKLPVHRAVAYADWALRRFFARAETMDWARRTLFVFTADHTGPSEEEYSPVRAFHVPISFLVLGKELPPCDSIGSHIDVLPSILEAIGYPYPVPVWGKSLWNRNGWRWAPQKPLPLLFQAVGRREVISFSPNSVKSTYKWQGKPWNILPDSVLPSWYSEWMAYLASYGKWIEGENW
ncbi:MAG: LTA synthase family protein [Bacteroidia bacterium]|nr:LTA synthase family protein [Bacteroidia bacterium]MDW8133634.1 LTA synthase family protein [Bacteroidia bacterium]